MLPFTWSKWWTRNKQPQQCASLRFASVTFSREPDYEDEEKYHEKEKRADRFAADFFIPRAEFDNFTATGVFTESTISAFAEQLNISPGIVVGRLQSQHIISYKNLNYLKTKYFVSFSNDKKTTA